MVLYSQVILRLTLVQLQKTDMSLLKNLLETDRKVLMCKMKDDGDLLNNPQA
jgi:hypothetical protein